MSQHDCLVTCQLLSVRQYPLQRQNGYPEISPTPGSERVSRGLLEYRSMIGTVNLDELVAPVAGLASANQRLSCHWVWDILTSKGDCDITLTTKVERDATLEHLDPGHRTEHWCLALGS